MKLLDFNTVDAVNLVYCVFLMKPVNRNKDSLKFVKYFLKRDHYFDTILK